MFINKKYIDKFKGLKGLILGTGSIGTRHKSNLDLLGVSYEIASFKEIGLIGIVEKIKCTNADFIFDALGTNHRHTIIPYIIEKKIPFYIEKPAYFDKSFEDFFSEMSINLQRKSVVGFMMRYNPLVQSLLEDIDLLNPFTASMQVGHDVNKWRDNWNFDKSYASNKFGGGVLLDLCHEIDLANILFSVDEVLSVNSKKHKNFKVDFVTTCLLRNSNRDYKDILTNINLNYLSPNLIRQGSVYGINGEINFDFVKSRKTKNIHNKQQVYFFENDRNKMFLDLTIDFLMSLIDEKVQNPLFPSLVNTKKSNQLIASCYEIIKF